MESPRSTIGAVGAAARTASAAATVRAGAVSGAYARVFVSTWMARSPGSEGVPDLPVAPREGDRHIRHRLRTRRVVVEKGDRSGHGWQDTFWTRAESDARVQIGQIRQVFLADRLGFDYYSMSEHHFQPEGAEFSPNPLLAETAIDALFADLLGR